LIQVRYAWVTRTSIMANVAYRILLDKGISA
jgi:hypothetical protein